MTSILTIIQQQDDEYDRLHAEYEEAKQRVDSATTPGQRRRAIAAFHPIQQAFLRNRERATPTECYQIIASFLDRESRARLAECDRHQHYQVIYGKYSGVFVWSVGGLLEQVYRRTYKKRPERATVTPLRHASREGTSRVVRVLIDAKANLEAIDDNEYRTALHWACSEGHEEVVGVLIDAGADVNALDALNHSPMYAAVGAWALPANRRLSAKETALNTRCSSIVRRLLAARAHPNLGLHRPLNLAANRNSCDLVSILLETKADINYRDWNDDTVLHHATSHSDSADVIPILVAAGVDVDSRNNFGLTPLLQVSGDFRSSPAIALLEAKADPNIVDNHGHSPLMLACRLGWSLDTVHALLAANANVNLVDNHGHTAVQRAKRAGAEDMVELLLAAGAEDLDDDDVVDNESEEEDDVVDSESEAEEDES